MQRDADEVLPDEHGETQRRDVGQRDSSDDHHRGDEAAQQDQYHAEYEGERGHGAGDEVLTCEGLDVQQGAARPSDTHRAACQRCALDGLQCRRDDLGAQVHGLLAEPLLFRSDDHPGHLAVGGEEVRHSAFEEWILEGLRGYEEGVTRVACREALAQVIGELSDLGDLGQQNLQGALQRCDNRVDLSNEVLEPRQLRTECRQGLSQRAGSVHQIADKPVETVQIVEEGEAGECGLAIVVIAAVRDPADEVLGRFGRPAQRVDLLYDGGQAGA